MLHIVNKTPGPALEDCLRFCRADDRLLLIEDGVYAALRQASPIVRLCAAVGEVLALAPDVDARGLRSRLDPRVRLVDHAGFVQLCCEHSPVHSWC